MTQYYFHILVKGHVMFDPLDGLERLQNYKIQIQIVKLVYIYVQCNVNCENPPPLPPVWNIAKMKSV